ncbi:hypothetical protein V5799_016086 [Amblyomma americanum]|uniref:2-phosphoxylose phosphatase 1 n=1 Tax=Amblyomma americanum TaxID=6943 RepID=A0AAQ4F770_AMBAM
MQVNARSSPVPRCFDSAALLLYGLYPAQGESRRWKPDQDWQPVVITSVPDGTDKYATLCMRRFEATIGALSTVKEPPSLVSQPSDSMTGTASSPMHPPQRFGTAGNMLEYVAKMAHVTEKPGVARFTAIARVLDALFVYREYNMPLPEWATKHLRQLWWLNEQLVVLIARYQMDNMAGPMLRDVVASVRMGKAKGVSLTQGTDDTDQGPKITLLSYHDMNVAGALLGLNDTLTIRPHYGAAVIVEVLSPRASETPERYVRVLYKAGKNVSNIPIEGCNDPCPLQQFDEFLKRKFKPVSRAQCGWSEDQPLV